MNTLMLVVLAVVLLCYCGGKYCPKVLSSNKEMLLGVLVGLALCSFAGLRLEGLNELCTPQRGADECDQYGEGSHCRAVEGEYDPRPASAGGTGGQKYTCQIRHVDINMNTDEIECDPSNDSCPDQLSCRPARGVGRGRRYTCQ